MPRKGNAKKIVNVVVQNQPHKKPAAPRRAAKSYGSSPFAPVQVTQTNGLNSRMPKLRQNSLMSGGSRSFQFDARGKGMPFCHREFIADISGSVEFKNTSYPINPGLVRPFQFQSGIAENFEEYEFTGLRFVYRPTSGSAVSSSSAALGVVVMATDYNVLNPPFASKQVMETYEYSNSCVPFTQCIHGVECKPRNNVMDSYFVRTGNPPANADLRLYDLGNFQIATSGMQGVYVIGELWVEYEGFYRKPRSPATSGGGGGPVMPSNTWAHIRNKTDQQCHEEIPFGANGPEQFGNLDGCYAVQSPDSVILKNEGYYLIFSAVYEFNEATGFHGSAQLLFGENLGPFSPGPFNHGFGEVDFLYADDTDPSHIVRASEFYFIYCSGYESEDTNYIEPSNLGGLTAGNLDIFIMAISAPPVLLSKTPSSRRSRKKDGRKEVGPRHGSFDLVTAGKDEAKQSSATPVLRSSANRGR